MDKGGVIKENGDRKFIIFVILYLVNVLFILGILRFNEWMNDGRY